MPTVDFKCLQRVLTLLQVKRHLKQNWCRHESVKDLLRHVPRHMAQLGGGDPRPPSCRGLLSSLLTLLGLAPELSSCVTIDISMLKLQKCTPEKYLAYYMNLLVFRLWNKGMI